MNWLSIKYFSFSFSIFLSSICITRSAVAQDAPPASKPETTAKTRSIMDQIFVSLTTVLPMSMDRNEYSSPANRDKISGELKKMNESTSALVEHTKKFEGSYGFVAKSMSRDIRDTYNWYQKGSYSESRYLLQQVSENCVSCHMKLPDPGHAPKMDQFFKETSIAKLAPPERARLQVALRQFDDALKTWEDMFASHRKPNELFAMDALTEYLKVAIRVKSDPARAEKTLTALTKRTDLLRFMQREVKSWKNSLVKLGPEVKKQGKELSRAAKIVQTARLNMDYPLDRTGLVDFIVASSLLNRTLNEGKPSKDDQSHAYYLLGLTETLIGRNTWLTQTDFYFEAAIRTAPKSKYAQLAFDALEQQLLLEYSGSGGINIPDDIRANLEELRALVSKT